jgi:hypothetical protein
MDEYNILNNVKPVYFRGKFPYSIINPESIKFTMNKIVIWAKEEKKSNNKVGGGTKRVTPKIKFYG